MSRRAKTIRIDHRAVVTALRSKPGVWLPVADYRNCITADRVAHAIRHGRPLGRASNALYIPAGAYEVRTELVEDGTRIHARYIGEEACS